MSWNLIETGRAIRVLCVSLCAVVGILAVSSVCDAGTLVTEEKFEGSFSSYWYRAMNNYSYSGNFSTNYAVSPMRSYRFEVRDSDAPFEDGMRSELESQAEAPLLERTYNFSVYLPKGGTEDYANDKHNAGEVIIQWHNNPDPGEEWTRPPLALFTDTRSDGTGNYILQREWDEDPISTDEKIESENKLVEYDLGSLEGDKGRWVRWTFHVKWGWLSSQNPILEVYKDGVLIKNLNGLPNTTNDQKGVNQQFGMYKWAWNERDSDAGSILTKRVIYFDDVSVYDGWEPPTSTGAVSTPVFSPSAGAYSSTQSVAISSSTAGATIYYTTDGTTPTTSSSVYSSPVSVSSAKTIKAIGVKSGMTSSAVASAAYTIIFADTTLPSITISSPASNQTVNTSSITVSGTASDNVSLSKVEVSLNGGAYQLATGTTSWNKVLALAPGSNTITARATDTAGNTKTSSVTITYAPSVSTYALTVTSGTGTGSYQQGTPVTIIANAAIATKVFDKWTGDVSCVASVTSAITTIVMPAGNVTLTATYRDVPIASTPVFTWGGGVSSGMQIVAISSSTIGSDIYYTLDGTTPTVSSTLYTGPISISSDKTIKAIAVKGGYANSAVGSATCPTNPSQTFTLTVNSGTGTGNYAAGARITINANAPQAGKIFDRWTGDTAYLSSVAASSAILTMPDKSIVLTAAYKNQIVSYPTGTLVKLAASNKIYVMIDGKKKWIPTPQVFTQLGYKWTEIKVLTEQEFNSIPDYEDNLIRGVGDYKVYLVVNGIKRHIPNPQVFLDYGFSWNDIKDVDATIISEYKDAYLIREDGKEEVYYLNSQGVRKHIPTAEIFNSYNDKWEDVQIISSYEMSVYPLSNLIKLQGANDVYLIEGSVKRRIPNVSVFDKYRLNWQLIVSVNAAEFSWYKDGLMLQ